jgi:hypothetical protein
MYLFGQKSGGVNNFGNKTTGTFNFGKKYMHHAKNLMKLYNDANEDWNSYKNKSLER